ncbi:CapA family protein [Mesorhizobium sp. M0678]|uniref:CapA family protein n=1 Tax=Mesorhizobium sp. M0678 TaxID=2956985 RepID=UPI00333C3A55
MSHTLPSSPMDVFPATREMLEAARKAKLFGWWDFPLEVVTVDDAEADATDWAYWYYTSGNPITRTKQEVSETVFQNDASVVALPAGFRKEESLTFGAAGDLIRAEGLEHSKDILFGGIKDILFDVDVSFANLEQVVADDSILNEKMGDGQELHGICCSTLQYYTMIECNGERFDVLNMANNHALDLGVERLSATHDLLSRDGIMDIGAPRSEEEYGKGKVFNSNGIKLGFVSATYGLNGKTLPEGEEYRVHTSKLMSKYAPTDLDLLLAQIDDCKKRGCDFIVASIHWGVDCEFFPRLRQIEAAHTLVEAGVDLIIGAHPHVIQPVEYYRTKRDPNRIAVIAYSLGSLTWGWYTAPHLILSLVLNLELARGRMDGEYRTYIKGVRPIPVFRNISYEGDKRLMRIEKLQGHLGDVGGANKDIDQMKKYADLVLGGAWQT